MSGRPRPDEYAPFYETYVGRVPEERILPVLERQIGELTDLARALPPALELYRYAPGKWSVREVCGHLTDAERVFGHRAFRFSRGDQTPLPGFDERLYVAGASFDRRPVAEHLAELELARRLNLTLLAGLPEDAWSRVGIANGHPITVRALAWTMAGHLRHHLAILHERYGVGA